MAASLWEKEVREEEEEERFPSIDPCFLPQSLEHY